MTEPELADLEAQALRAAFWNADDPRFVAWARDAGDEGGHVFDLVAEVRRLQAELEGANISAEDNEFIATKMQAERDEARADLENVRVERGQERNARLRAEADVERLKARFDADVDFWVGRVADLTAQAAALRAALEHCIDLGPPCPSCGAEDEEVESEGQYPHASDCLAMAALWPEALK